MLRKARSGNVKDVVKYHNITKERIIYLNSIESPCLFLPFSRTEAISTPKMVDLSCDTETTCSCHNIFSRKTLTSLRGGGRGRSKSPSESVSTDIREDPFSHLLSAPLGATSSRFNNLYAVKTVIALSFCVFCDALSEVSSLWSTGSRRNPTWTSDKRVRSTSSVSISRNWTWEVLIGRSAD